MVPLWFSLSALCFVGAAVLLYVDLDQRRGRSRRRKSWARSQGFDFEPESAEILQRWKRGVMSTVGNAPVRNVVLGQIRGEAVYVFDLEEVATVVALHRKIATNVVVDVRLKGLKEPRENDIWLLGAIGPRMVYSTNLDAARRACDRRMVTFAHTAPDCAEIMWNEANWTLVSMPITSTRGQWDEGLRCARQFNDLLRVLPPMPRSQPAELTAGDTAGRRNGEPSRPSASAADVASAIAASSIEDSVADRIASRTGSTALPDDATAAAEPRSRRRSARNESLGLLQSPLGRNGWPAAHHQR